MGKFSEWIRNPGTGGPGTRDGIRQLGFALLTDFPTQLSKFLRVDQAQSFSAGEKTQGRSNLGVIIGTDVQAYDAGLASIAGLTTVADRMLYTTGSDAYAVTPLTAFGRSLIDDANAAAAQATLGLGSLATQAANGVAITGGSISGITDLAVADGGTGASTAAAARTNLGLGSIATQDASNVAITGGAIANTALSAGAIIDRAYAEYLLNTSITTQIPLDDTIPQVTEGAQLMSLSFTPKSATNRLRIRVSISASTLLQSAILAAVFSDLSANALASGYVVTDAANYERQLYIEFEWVPGSTATRTISVRGGPGTGTTMYTNGNSSGRVLGGTMRCSMIVEEIKA